MYGILINLLLHNSLSYETDFFKKKMDMSSTFVAHKISGKYEKQYDENKNLISVYQKLK